MMTHRGAIDGDRSYTVIGLNKPKIGQVYLSVDKAETEEGAMMEVMASMLSVVCVATRLDRQSR